MISIEFNLYYIVCSTIFNQMQADSEANCCLLKYFVIHNLPSAYQVSLEEVPKYN
jgi:hypothetical protein